MGLRSFFSALSPHPILLAAENRILAPILGWRWHFGPPRPLLFPSPLRQVAPPQAEGGSEAVRHGRVPRLLLRILPVLYTKFCLSVFVQPDTRNASLFLRFLIPG